ncbi:MAG: PH domain-containing protein [Pseudoxanthomonas sp.]
MSKARTTTQEFAVVPPSPALYWFFAALWLALTTLVLLRTDASGWHADPVPWWLVPPFACALLVVGPMIWVLHRRISIKDGSLVVAAGIGSRKQAIAGLALDKARILDLDEHTGFKPMLRLFGAGLPGYRTGHYLLRNRARAFCLLTCNERVLVLPQLDGKLILLSPENPQALLEKLRELAQETARR